MTAASHSPANSEIDCLLEIMAQLRDPETGCPWDKVQTFETIAPYTIEEAYEVAEAITQGDMDGLQSELGDLLFRVVFYAQMSSETGGYAFADHRPVNCRQDGAPAPPRVRWRRLSPRTPKPLSGKPKSAPNVRQKPRQKEIYPAFWTTCQQHFLLWPGL